MSLRKLCITIAIFIVISDQISKILIQQVLAFGQSSPMMPFINFYLTHNEGAAFSMLSTAGGWQRWFLAALSLGASVMITLWIMRLPEDEKITGISLALILGGAVGNLIDRLFMGYVVDFIDFYYHTNTGCLFLFNKWFDQACHYATFNVADSAISIGVALFIISSLYASYKELRA